MEWQQVKVVFSVGPYPLIRRHDGNRASTFRTWVTASQELANRAEHVDVVIHQLVKQT
jgi:hypothetical protein